MANSRKFWTLSGPNRWHAEWVGRWDGRDEDGTRQRTEIGFVKKTVNGLLKARGYDAAKVVSMWRANGWLRDTPGRNGLKTRMGAGEPYLPIYGGRRSAFDQRAQDQRVGRLVGQPLKSQSHRLGGVPGAFDDVRASLPGGPRRKRGFE